jgi:hypothetical protein
MLCVYPMNPFRLIVVLNGFVKPKYTNGNGGTKYNCNKILG